jgi:hypothetical protein
MRCSKYVYDAMRIVDVHNYFVKMAFERLMGDALYMPIFEYGNVGIRMRQLQGLMMPLAAISCHIWIFIDKRNVR